MIAHAKINRLRKLFLIVCVFAITLFFGCAGNLNQQAYKASQPHRIGVVIGHDISAVSSMSTGEEIFIGLSFGLVGVAVAEGTADEWRLKFDKDINKMFYEKIHNVLQEKNYDVHFLGFKSKRWILMENVSDTEDVYPNLVNYYEVGDIKNDYDAFLFIEYLFEGRLEGRFSNKSNLEDLTIDNMKMLYAKSKIFLYDTKTGQRIFHDMVQRGYPSFSNKTVSEALDTIISLDSLPVVP